MKTKIFIFLITLFIFSFKLQSFANADYSCTVYCSIDNSTASFNTCTLPVTDPYDPDGCSYSCGGSPCAVSTTAPTTPPAPTSGGICVNEHGFYSGPSGTFPCCSGLTPCSSTGTCEISCSGGTCVNEHGFYSGPSGTFPCCSGLTPCASTGTCETSCPGQVCTPGTLQYVCSGTHC
jgi:hypothetical protein